MATITSFDADFNSNQVVLNFDEAITSIQTANVYLVGDGTSTTGGVSLQGATVTGLGTSTLTLALSDETINEIKNQTTDYVSIANTGLYTTFVDTTVPALDAADTNYGFVGNYTQDLTRPTLESVTFLEDINVDANGDVTSFSFKTDKPLTTLPLITEISAVDTSDSSTVALTADSSLAKSTTDPKVITVSVGTTDRTTFSDKFNIATGALSIATTTARDWADNNFAATQQVDVTFVSGAVLVTEFDFNGSQNRAIITFTSSDISYVDPSGFKFTLGGNIITLTGGTATQSSIDNAVWLIDFNNADTLAYQQAAITNGGVLSDDNTYLNAVGTTFPETAQLIEPLLVSAVSIDDSDFELQSFDLFTTDSTAPYDAIFTFSAPFFTSGSFFDVTAFTLADEAAATPTNSRALTSGSTFTYLGANPAGGARYGLSLNTADATAINAWAASGSMFVSLTNAFSLSWAYNGASAILPANGLAAAQFVTSISPEYEYDYGDISVRSNNLAGEMKLSSDYKYDAITFKVDAATQVGGVYEFGEAPTSSYAGRYLTINSADTTDAANPVFTLDWANQPVTSLIAGDNITLSGSTGNVVVSASGGGSGATHYTGDAGDLALPTTAQINAAISGTPVNGDSFLNTNAGSNNTQPYYNYVNGGWRQISSLATS